MIKTHMGNTTTCANDTDSHSNPPSITYDTQYDVQWTSDQQMVIYDFHRYEIDKFQPISLKPNEVQMKCPHRGCNHYIRVRRMVNSKRWIVTKYVMHDNWNGHSHKQIKHELYTPTAQHMRMVTTIAKQEAELTCRPARAAVESQILQNPKINQFASVPSLKRKIGRIAGNCLLDNLPPLPTCPASAAQSLRTHPIWCKNFYTHCEHILSEKLKQMETGGQINFTLDMNSLMSSDTLSKEEKLVEGQVQLGRILLDLKDIQETLQLARMSLNGTELDKQSDFLISMRLNGSMMIFGHRMFFHMLKACSTIAFDQLCRICPNLNGRKAWTQSWILHALFESNSVDLKDESFATFIVLMDDHDEQSYHEILNILVDYAKKNIDESYVCLSKKNVRLMGDWSMAEHNAMTASKYVDSDKDDGCGWHFINGINGNMKTKNVIGYYYTDDDFRQFIRYFEALRSIHLDCADMACDLIRKKAWRGIRGPARDAFRQFFDEYLDKIWRKKYGLEMLNCQGSFVMDNNYSEGWNRKTLIDLGKRETWWIFLWNTKRYMQVVVAKYNGFKHNGFQRQRGSDRRKRCKALKTIWNTFEEKNRQNKDVIWNYLECLYLCWEQEYDALYSKLDSL